MGDIVLVQTFSDAGEISDGQKMFSCFHKHKGNKQIQQIQNFSSALQTAQFSRLGKLSTSPEVK